MFVFAHECINKYYVIVFGFVCAQNGPVSVNGPSEEKAEGKYVQVDRIIYIELIVLISAKFTTECKKLISPPE